MQNDMINQNKGLTNACCAILGFCDDEDELALVEYTRSKIKEINSSEAEEVMTKE